MLSVPIFVDLACANLANIARCFFQSLEHDGTQVLLADGFAPCGRPFHEQDGLLQVRREKKQVHKLTHPGTRDARHTGYFRIVSKLARPHQILDAMSQRNQPRRSAWHGSAGG